MNTFKTVFRQTSWQLVGKAVSSVSTVVTLGIIARNYGEASTGVVTLALTWLAFFVLATDFGLNAYTLPHLLERDPSLFWRKVFGLRIVLGSILTILSLVTALFWPANHTFRTLVLTGTFFAIFEAVVYFSCIAIFQAKLRYHLSTLAYSLGALTQLGLVFLLTLNSAGVESLMGAYIGGWLVTALLSLMFVKSFVRPLFPLVDFGFIKNTLRTAWPISLTLVLNTVYFRVDSFIIEFYRGFADVGVYNIAYSFFQSALVVPAFVTNAFYPIMVKSMAVSWPQFRESLLGTAAAMLGLSLLAVLAAFSLAPLLVGLLTAGHGFSGSEAALRILSLGFPAYFLSALGMWTLVTMRRYRQILAIYLVGLALNILLNLVFIPSHSYIAASWVTGASEYLILVLQTVILLKEFRARNSKAKA